MSEDTRGAEVVTPIIIDLGKTKRKRIKRLKRGRGRLMEEVTDVLEEVRASLGEEGADKHLVPIVMVYRRKRRKKKYEGIFPFFA